MDSTYLNAILHLVVPVAIAGTNTCCWPGPVTLETPGLSFHRAVGPRAKFLRESEDEMLWETLPHSKSSDSLLRRSDGLPQQQKRLVWYPNQHLCLWLFPIHSFQPHPSMNSFSTPTVLYAYDFLSLHLSRRAAWLC